MIAQAFACHRGIDCEVRMLSEFQGPAERVALVETSSSRRTVENPPLPDAQHTGTEFRDSRAKLVAMEDSMIDLYAINLHLQERLERDWRKEDRAAEAAVWLDDAGLLRDYKRRLPLRRLLRAARIAGQQQRPDGRNRTKRPGGDAQRAGELASRGVEARRPHRAVAQRRDARRVVNELPEHGRLPHWVFAAAQRMKPGERWSAGSRQSRVA